MGQFKLVQGRFTSDIEDKLNKLCEDYVGVNVQSMTYDYNTHQYTLVVKLGEEIHPMTYYVPINVHENKLDKYNKS